MQIAIDKQVDKLEPLLYTASGKVKQYGHREKYLVISQKLNIELPYDQ